MADAWCGGATATAALAFRRLTVGTPARMVALQRLLGNRHELALLPGTARMLYRPGPGPESCSMVHTRTPV